jgi:hypothetical protein
LDPSASLTIDFNKRRSVLFYLKGEMGVLVVGIGVVTGTLIGVFVLLLEVV